MKLAVCALILSCAAALTAAQSACAGNLVQNGGFEQPPSTFHNGCFGLHGISYLDSWTATGTLELQNIGCNIVSAFEGSQVLELDAAANYAIAQTVNNVESGSTCTLSFDYLARTRDGSSDLLVTAGDGASTVLSQQYNAASNPGGAAGPRTMDRLTTVFTTGAASTGSVTLTFTAQGSSNSLGAMIDAVCMTCVCPDADRDGVCDSNDNCKYTPNPGQEASSPSECGTLGDACCTLEDEAGCFNLGVGNVNALALNRFVGMSSDSQGPVVVGGQADLTNYGVGNGGGAAGTDSLVSLGPLTATNGQVYNGDVSMTAANTLTSFTVLSGNANEDAVSKYGVPHLGVAGETYFSMTGAGLNALSSDLCAASGLLAPLNPLNKDIELELYSDTYNVFRVYAGDLNQARSVTVKANNKAAGAAIVVNVLPSIGGLPAVQNIVWTNCGMSVPEPHKCGVLLNFCVTGTVQIGSVDGGIGVKGSVLAVQASAVQFGNAHIDGQMLASNIDKVPNFSTTGQYHHVPFCACLPSTLDSATPPSDPNPSLPAPSDPAGSPGTCTWSYSGPQWGNGYTVNLRVNAGVTVDGWRIDIALPPQEQVVNSPWNAVSQQDSVTGALSMVDMGHNSLIDTTLTNVGFNVDHDFAWAPVFPNVQLQLNGVDCTLDTANVNVWGASRSGTGADAGLSAGATAAIGIGAGVAVVGVVAAAVAMSKKHDHRSPVQKVAVAGVAAQPEVIETERVHRDSLSRRRQGSASRHA